MLRQEPVGAGCGKGLRLIAEETSERYEYIPASLKAVQDVSRKYTCDCTVRTVGKPPQPIGKSTARALTGAGDRGKVGRSPTVAPAGKYVRAPWRGDLAQDDGRMDGPVRGTAGSALGAAKKELVASHVIGTDDTGVKVLDPALEFAQTGRIWS